MTGIQVKPTDHINHLIAPLRVQSFQSLHITGQSNNGGWENRRKSELRVHVKLAKIRHLCNSNQYFLLPFILLLYPCVERKQKRSPVPASLHIMQVMAAACFFSEGQPLLPQLFCVLTACVASVFPPNFHIPLAASGFALCCFGVVSEWQMSVRLPLFSWEFYSL